MAIIIKRLHSINALGHLQSDQESFCPYMDLKSRTVITGFSQSGKTALTRLFRVLEHRDSLSEFPGAEYVFELSDGTLVNQSADLIPRISVKVFNEQFVAEHISWDETDHTFTLKESIDIDLFNEKMRFFSGCQDIKVYRDKWGFKYWIGNDATTGATKASLERHPLDVINKTAIAFVYFAVRLHQQDIIEDSVIVIDDLINPRHLANVFAAYRFVKEEFWNAAQLIIFAHYPLFYKLILNWFEKE